MTQNLILIGLLLAAPGPLYSQTNTTHLTGANEALTADQQAVAEREREWAGAVQKRDAVTIDRLQSSEYTFVAPNGRIWTKKETLETIKAGDLEIDSFELSDMNVRVYENTAVVSFRIVWSGSFRGSDISGPQRMTDVFVKRNGSWLCVASHATNIQSR